MIERVIEDYRQATAALLGSIDVAVVASAVDALRTVYENDQTIFVIGNGGSAANATHFAADFGKNAIPAGRRKVRILSLCTNTPAITALGNDVGFESIYREQLAALMRPGDLLIAYSVSGTSRDVIEAVSWAKEHGAIVIGLTGFTGGTLAALSDVSINTPSETYEVVEDMHGICSHMFTSSIKAIYSAG